ncbi:hypothetical protein QFC20_001591 [Naganishia adeliensis]|uniref:Uncharacterized protein n=1 Tax=Naganishia adeliensis TaxID=92952 RepID=A0ACC2WSI1_9TREE|nr:hypothetical protein QFC20_001591 [Naganishia adeliensis]
MSRHHHRPKESPPSTLKVLSYVAFVWFAWGIFTRLDETEHLRPPPSLRNAAHAASNAAHYAQSAWNDGERVVEDGLRGAWDGYQGLQRSDSGVYSLSFPRAPPSSRNNYSSSSNWFSTVFSALGKLVTYVVIYPVIAIFNIASFIIHYLSVTFLMLLTTAYYLSWPLHQLASMILSTFTAPMNLFLALIRFTEPLWTLAGGLLGAGATLGGTFAWLGNKAERRIYVAHEERQERRRVDQLEREIERREIELARERERADEQERRNRSLQLAGLHRRRQQQQQQQHRIPLPVRRAYPPPKSLFAVLVDKVFGTHRTLQEEYEEYYADLAVLEPPGKAQVIAWDAGAEEEERQHAALAYAVATAGGSRLLIAPSVESGLKKRTRRAGRVPVRVQSMVVQHQDRGHRGYIDGEEEDEYIPEIHHHLQDDSLPPVHTPPTDGLPPTPRRVVRARQPHPQQQPFMTFPTGNLVRAGGTRIRGASASNGGQGRRISFVDDQLRAPEEEPVEGEVFGYPDDDDDGEELDHDEDAQDHDQDADAHVNTATSNIHLHFHNNVPSTSAPAPRRKRTLRFQEDDEHTAREPSISDHAHHDPGDKYGTPFKRSSTRLGKQAMHAFEVDENESRAVEGPGGCCLAREMGCVVVW